MDLSVFEDNNYDFLNHELSDFDVIILGSKSSNTREFEVENVEIFDMMRKGGMKVTLLVEDGEDVRYIDNRSIVFTLVTIISTMAATITIYEFIKDYYEEREENKGNQDAEPSKFKFKGLIRETGDYINFEGTITEFYDVIESLEQR
ncbi:MAG: hypothetical protein HeimC2_21960 [Candidatus Heimdallarchaeota archaeon LC_2]|nr:MAG: hypothetical protein HeimC2_21960 [Candidatus Heimdallarchaeota archaeon LC_2]